MGPVRTYVIERHFNEDGSTTYIGVTPENDDVEVQGATPNVCVDLINLELDQLNVS